MPQRVTMLMRSNMLINGVQTNSADLLKVQKQLSSGLRLSRPSESPSEATTVMHLDSTLERQEQYFQNMQFANDYLSVTDTALGSAAELLREANTQALAGKSPGGNNIDGSYDAMAQIVDGIINSMVTLANSQCRGGYVFAGQNSNATPFVAENGGIMYSGSTDEMQTRIADDTRIDFSVNAQEAFGALSSEVIGFADLDPALTTDTLISDLNGATNQGVRLNSIRINDGVTGEVIDLAGCVTVGDIIDKINDSTLSVTASIAADNNSLQIVSGVGTVTVVEVGTGTAAADLGIYDAVGVGGNTLDGQDVDARLTLTTPLTALDSGAGIDLLSGINIQNSMIADIPTISFAGMTTIEEVLNAINSAGVGARAEINSDGTGINVRNLLSGSQMTIGENGGTTATDLGIRSMHAGTLLADLNGGSGVATTDGEIQITARDGSTFTVALDSLTTVGEVVTAIQNAATAAGVAVSAGLAVNGNGIELTDATGGAGNLTVTTSSTNNFFPAEQLGLDKSVASNTLTGDDVNAVQADGVFTHLIELRDALLAQDTAAIQVVADKLKADEVQINSLHGNVGSQVRALEDRKMRIEDNILALETLRSEIRDIDFSEAITRYQNIYTALQANLMTSSQLSDMSLLDFLA